MFKIKSYLHYKNTPNGKPRVLVEGVDYDHLDLQYLYNNFRDCEDGIGIAKSNCRPLLTVEIDGVEWTEGDILVGNDGIKIAFIVDENYGFKFVFRKANELWSDFLEGVYPHDKKLGSFFENPAKYSQLLWNCTEEEGWEKILKLLNINE